MSAVPSHQVENRHVSPSESQAQYTVAQSGHEGHCSDNHSLCELWRWRLKALQDVRLNKGCTYSLEWYLSEEACWTLTRVARNSVGADGQPSEGALPAEAAHVRGQL